MKNNQNINYEKLSILVSKFQNDITYLGSVNVMDIIDEYIEKFRCILEFDMILVLQPIYIGEKHELVTAVRDEKDFDALEEHLLSYGYLKRKNKISTIKGMSLYNQELNIESPLIDFDVYPYSVVNPIKNIYDNDTGNGLIILANKKKKILFTQTLINVVNILSTTVAIGLNKHRMNEILKRESVFINSSLNNINSAICIFENNGKIIRINESFSNLTGIIEKDAINNNIFDLLKLKDHYSLSDYMTITDKDYNKYNTTENVMYVEYISNKKKKILKKQFNNIIIDSIIYHMIVLDDITVEYQKIDQVEFMGLHDALTGLYNRNFYQEYTDKIRNNKKYPISVIVGDINGLKLMNDIFGHTYGDYIITTIANILNQHLINGEAIRMGGDEFYIFIENCDETCAKNYISNVYNNCFQMFSDFQFIGISLGSFTINDEKTIFDTAIRNAEAKMYYKKSIDQESIKKESLKKFKQLYNEKCANGKAHVDRLIKIAKVFSKYLGLRKGEMSDLIAAIEIHDIGKVAIEESLINKKTSYTIEEKENMITHCTIGYKIALLSYDTSHLARIVLSHHEAWNGRGFPQMLIANEIPYLARIISIIDNYDIFKYGNNNIQPLKDNEEILISLKKQRGKKLDPNLTNEFIEFLIKSKNFY